MPCRHLDKSEEAFAIGPDGERHPVTVHLCSLADNRPELIANLPRWLQRNALGGHQWREGDCEGCPCFDTAN
jgi:hypothetical protein